MSKVKITKRDGSIEYVELKGTKAIEIDGNLGDIERIDVLADRIGWHGVIQWKVHESGKLPKSLRI